MFFWRRLSHLHLCVLASTLITVVFYALTMHGDQGWGEDFAIYVRHGINIAKGLPYNHLGVPELLTGRVLTYPVGLPVIIAGVYSLFGIDFSAFKWAIILFLLIFLIVFISLARRFQAPSYVSLFLLAILVSINPEVWALGQEVFADLPFIFFTFFALYLYDTHCSPARDRLSEASGPEKRSVRSVISLCALSFAIVAAYSMRTVALLLPMSILAYEVVRYRRVRGQTLLILLPFAVFVPVQEYMIGTLSGYVREAELYLGVGSENAPRTPAANYVNWVFARALGPFRWSLGNYFAPGGPPILDSALAFGVVGIPAGIGYVSRLFRRFSVWEVFGPAYFAALVVSHVPAHERYLLPLFVLFLLYAIEGISVLTGWLRVSARGATYGFAAILLSGYAVEYVAQWDQYSTRENQGVSRGIMSPPAQELIAWIKDNTDENDVLAAQKANTISLMTWRKVGKIDWCSERERCFFLERSDWVWQYLRNIEVKYLVLMTADAPRDFYRPDKLAFEGIVEPQRDNFRVAFRNDIFEVLEILRHKVPDPAQARDG